MEKFILCHWSADSTETEIGSAISHPDQFIYLNKMKIKNKKNRLKWIKTGRKGTEEATEIQFIIHLI